MNMCARAHTHTHRQVQTYSFSCIHTNTQTCAHAHTHTHTFCVYSFIILANGSEEEKERIEKKKKKTTQNQQKRKAKLNNPQTALVISEQEGPSNSQSSVPQESKHKIHGIDIKSLSFKLCQFDIIGIVCDQLSGCQMIKIHLLSNITWLYSIKHTLCEVVCWLLNVPATCQCISGTDLLRQFYMLPH